MRRRLRGRSRCGLGLAIDIQAEDALHLTAGAVDHAEKIGSRMGRMIVQPIVRTPRALEADHKAGNPTAWDRHWTARGFEQAIGVTGRIEFLKADKPTFDGTEPGSRDTFQSASEVDMLFSLNLKGFTKLDETRPLGDFYARRAGSQWRALVVSQPVDLAAASFLAVA